MIALETSIQMVNFKLKMNKYVFLPKIYFFYDILI